MSLFGLHTMTAGICIVDISIYDPTSLEYFCCRILQNTFNNGVLNE